MTVSDYLKAHERLIIVALVLAVGTQPLRRVPKHGTPIIAIVLVPFVAYFALGVTVRQAVSKIVQKFCCHWLNT